MTRSKSAAMVCHTLAILPMLVGGIVYAIRDNYMSYHAEATAYAWQDLSPGLQVLFLAMLILSKTKKRKYGYNT